MNQRALDLAVVLGGHRASLGPGARSLGIHDLSALWTLIRIGMATDEQLRVLAEDFGLDQARTERRGRVWFRQAEARADRLVVIAAGPHHPGEPPDEGNGVPR